jgi:hypothetical protein
LAFIQKDLLLELLNVLSSLVRNLNQAWDFGTKNVKFNEKRMTTEKLNDFIYFVNDEQYTSTEEELTGAAIKAKLPESKRTEPLYLVEGDGERKIYHPIQDSAKVSLKGEPKYFVTQQKEYFYYVDGTEYESSQAHTTGAIIKSKLPEAKRGYALFEEGQGNQPDKLIDDSTSVTLEKHKPKRFYTAPPATAGNA